MDANVEQRVGLPDAPPRLQMLVDGEWREAESGERLTRISPAHGVAVSQTPLGAAGDADRAVAAAWRAFEHGWLDRAGGG